MSSGALAIIEDLCDLPRPVLSSTSRMCEEIVDNRQCENLAIAGTEPPRCSPHGGRVEISGEGIVSAVGPGSYRLIASLTGLSREHVGKVLSGKTRASIDCLVKICDCTNLTLDELFSYIEQNKSKKE